MPMTVWYRQGIKPIPHRTWQWTTALRVQFDTNTTAALDKYPLLCACFMVYRSAVARSHKCQNTRRFSFICSLALAQSLQPRRLSQWLSWWQFTGRSFMGRNSAEWITVIMPFIPLMLSSQSQTSHNNLYIYPKRPARSHLFNLRWLPIEHRINFLIATLKGRTSST